MNTSMEVILNSEILQRIVVMHLKPGEYIYHG